MKANIRKICKQCGQTKSSGEFYGRHLECKACSSINAKKYYSDHSAECKEHGRLYYISHRQEHLRKGKEWKAKNKDRVRATGKAYAKKIRFKLALRSSYHASKKNGYTACSATEQEIAAAFTGVCHACGIREEDLTRGLHLDHDHKTGEFRGWLCHGCNLALGFLCESDKRILSLLTYLENT